MELPLILSLILSGVLLYWSAWISSAEMALFSLPTHKIKTYKNDLDPTKKLIAELLARPRDLLVTVFMINTCVNILLQNVTSDMFGARAGWGLKVGVPLILTLIFGEIIPKYIGLQNNVAIAHRIAQTINTLQRSLTWLRKWIIAVTSPISRLMFFFLKKEHGISKEEIEHALQTSEKHGVLLREEAELLAGYLNLQDSQIKELMWPKEDILYFDTHQPLSKLVQLFTKENTTRIPVCSESLENVLGIATAMQYFKYRDKIQVAQDLIPYLQKPLYAPESTPAKLLLKRMDELGQVLALVVDEYGSISGLVSREDLIEVVVGQIEDPHDPPPLFIKAGKQEVITSGKWEISEFNDYFDAHLESPLNMITIGGWLIEQLGDIPKTGSEYELHGFSFHVLASSPTRILRLFIRKNSSRQP